VEVLCGDVGGACRRELGIGSRSAGEVSGMLRLLWDGQL